jgi:hypothetical protein
VIDLLDAFTEAGVTPLAAQLWVTAQSPNVIALASPGATRTNANAAMATVENPSRVTDGLWLLMVVLCPEPWLRVVQRQSTIFADGWRQCQRFRSRILFHEWGAYRGVYYQQKIWYLPEIVYCSPAVATQPLL